MRSTYNPTKRISKRYLSRNFSSLIILEEFEWAVSGILSLVHSPVVRPCLLIFPSWNETKAHRTTVRAEFTSFYCRFHFASNMSIACQVLRQELPVGEALRKWHGPQYAGVRKLRALCVSVIFAEHTFRENPRKYACLKQNEIDSTAVELGHLL